MNYEQLIFLCFIAVALIGGIAIGRGLPRNPSPSEAAKVLGRAGRAKQLKAARKSIDQTTAELRAIVGR